MGLNNKKNSLCQLATTMSQRIGKKQENDKAHSDLMPIGVATGDKGANPPEVLAYLVILCFEGRYPKQKAVAR